MRRMVKSKLACLSFLCPLLLVFVSTLTLGPTAHVTAQTIDFNRDIRPILSDKCFHCHGPDEHSREADLRFDVEDSAKADLGGYAAIVPGNAAGSELLVRVMATSEDEVMPPPHINKPVSQSEIDLLRRWIEEGAVWEPHWAYVAPVSHEVPEVPKSIVQSEAPEVAAWALSWIDRTILKRLAEESLLPSPRADSVDLVRRLCFDLTGLPPTDEQVAAFESIDSSQGYAAFVDTLLSSEAFGERLASYWLDLVRFADTVGYHGDQDHNVAPYRDYVIDAFNSNKPFDQFTVEQLAGDLLENPTREQKIATGYNRLLQTTHEGGLQPKEYRAIYAADRVRNVSAVWMGATVGCAQCHDHKYDPYSTRDFYTLSAFFADIDDENHFKSGTNSVPTNRPPEIALFTPEQQATFDQLKEERDRLRKEKRAIEKDAQSSAQSGEAENSAKSDVSETRLAEIDQELQSTTKSIDAMERSVPWSLITVALDKPRTTRILPRGNWLDESGEVVEPAVPAFLPAPGIEGRRLNRLDLARWLVDTEDGYGLMLARVFANRFWYLFFGTGISEVLDDLGGQGQPPVHPELLDNLALEFAKDWDVKRIVKLIVTSEAYQQQSIRSEALRRVDPMNRWIGAQSSYRLPAEMVRDNALAISGLLNRQIGGKKSKPYQPTGYYRHLNFPQRKYAHDQDDNQYRRGVYVHWQRQFLHPMLKAFDAPRREECTASRPKSNTPLAALALLNDPTFVEAARVFAERITQTAGDDKDHVAFAFRQATSRLPNDEEADTCSPCSNSSGNISIRMQRPQWNSSRSDYPRRTLSRKTLQSLPPGR